MDTKRDEAFLTTPEAEIEASAFRARRRRVNDEQALEDMTRQAASPVRESPWHLFGFAAILAGALIATIAWRLAHA